MGFFRRIAGFLGLTREDDSRGAGAGGVARGDAGAGGEDDERRAPTAPPRSGGGFGVQIPVSVERASPGPLLVPCDHADGEVQGFKWYTRRLRIDDDGDVADEFLEEIRPSGDQMTMPKFQVKFNSHPTAKMAMRKQAVAADGNIHQSLEYKGRLRWV